MGDISEPKNIIDEHGKKVGTYELIKLGRGEHVPEYELHVYGLDDRRMGVVSCCGDGTLFIKNSRNETTGIRASNGAALPAAFTIPAASAFIEQGDASPRELAQAFIAKVQEAMEGHHKRGRGFGEPQNN